MRDSSRFKVFYLSIRHKQVIIIKLLKSLVECSQQWMVSCLRRYNAIWNPGNLKESILESGYHKVAQESILESGSDSRIDSSLW